MKKTLIVIIFILILASVFTSITFAHSGGTDSKGGHYDHSTGDYHYHHGHPAHKHPNGVCPYGSSNSGIALLNGLFDLIGAAIGMFGLVVIFAGFADGGEHSVHILLIGVCIIWFAIALVSTLKALVAGSDLSSAWLYCGAPLLMAGVIYLYIKYDSKI